MHTREEKLEAFGRLLDVLDELREKCPWDKKQTNSTLRTNTIEEVYELCDALLNDDSPNICKELGDVLLHVLFYSVIANEKKQFDIADVCNKEVEKYVDDEADDDDRLEEPEILVTYEAWIESVDQLFNNERVTDEELLEDDKEDGMWQVEIMAHLVADNGTYFTREELLFKLHNLMANKELGDHVFFEGIEYEGHECEGYGLIDNEDGIPVFYTCCGS